MGWKKSWKFSLCEGSSYLRVLMVTIFTSTFVCQALTALPAQAAANLPLQSDLTTAADAFDLSSARRVLTLPDAIVSLSVAGSATYALAAVAPDNQLRLFTSGDGGTTWNYAQRRIASPIPTSGQQQGVFGLEGAPNNSQLVFVGSDEALISYTNNNGETWAKLTDTLPGGNNVKHFMAMAQTDKLRLWVAGGNQLWAFMVSGSDGALLQTDKYTLPSVTASVSAITVNQTTPNLIYVGAGLDLLSFDSGTSSWQTLNRFPAGQVVTLAAAANSIWAGVNDGDTGRLFAFSALNHDNSWFEVSKSLDFDLTPAGTLFPIKQVRLQPSSGLVALLTVASATGQPTIYVSQDTDHFHALSGYNASNPTTLLLRSDAQLLLGTANSGLYSTDPQVPSLPGVTVAPPNPLFPQNNKPNADYYQETGHYLAEPFRAYWQQHGGLALFGYPLTEAFDEISSEDGKIYQTQYFERARFEYHPEFAGTNNQILLGLLGKVIVPNVSAKTPISLGQSPAGSQFFANTGHSLSGAFLKYWQSQGGLALFGYPVTEPFQEVNRDDGKSYLVQYFERNRFEFHPEFNGTTNQVLLGLLGKQIANQRQVVFPNLGLVAVSGQTIIPWGENGKVYDQVFHSPVLNRDEPYRIYLPPGYATDTGRRYPVLYMLHGYSGNRVEWFNYGLFNVADKLIVQNQIQPMIIVLPTGDQEYWVDHANGGLKWGTYVAQDVVGFIDQNYRTKANRQNRAIGGLSMGGHGGLQVGLNFSNVFGIVSGTSSTLRDQKNVPGFFGDATWFAAHDPISLAETLDPKVLNSIKLWIDIGADDKDWVGRNQILHDVLTSRGIPHEWNLQPGGHTFDYWVADVPILLKWYASVFTN